jgi:hypothetical protein
MAEKANRYFVKNVTAIIGSIILFIVVAGSFYDVSFDGQWYHQETVSYLNQGYNPAYQTLAVPSDEVNDVVNMCNPIWPGDIPQVKQIYPLKNIKYVAINNFSKGSEVIQAAIYQVTNRIETGKAMNFMLLMGAFFLCLSVLYRIPSISNTKKWLLAILLAFNPIVIVQLLTFCVDGNMGCLFLCLLAIACLIFSDNNKYYLFLLISIGSMAINIKYTGLAYTVILGVGFIVILWIYKKTEAVKKVLIAGLIAFAIGLTCSGFNPYINNIITKGNIFYGLEEIKIISFELTPPTIRNLNRVEKLAMSVLTHEGSFAAQKTAVWHIPKVPFYFTKEDIAESYDSEQMLSGFGPFFGGAMLVACIVFLMAIIRIRKTKAFSYAMVVIIIVLITVLMIEDAWWVRYVPQFWLLPVIILCLSTFIATRSARIFSNVLYVSLGLSLVWASLNLFFNLVTTSRIDYQLQQLKKTNAPIAVQYSGCRGFKTNSIRFAEAGIAATKKEVNGPYVVNVLESNTKIQTSGPLPVLPKPFMLVLSEKLFGSLFVEKSY